MAKRKEGTIYRLVFDDEFAIPGLVVRARGVSLGLFLEISDLADGALERAQVEKLFDEFAKVLVDWDLEDDHDKPVPCDKSGLYFLELPEVKAIIDAWRDAMVGVTEDLATPSGNGEQFPEGSIPSETLPQSQAS
jgi:hypothetical protein